MKAKRPVLRKDNLSGNGKSPLSRTDLRQNAHMAVPLLINGRVFGILYAMGDPGMDLNSPDLQFLSELAKRASIGLENKYLYESVFDILISTLRSLVSTIEARDPYTREHSQRVTDLAVLIAKEMAYGLEEIDTLRTAGYLHDIGKIGVRDSVLLKPGPLTKGEFDQIKAHPVIGESILAPIGFLQEERIIIRHHHERWDGKGYPDGLAGSEIPRLARIISVADSFDAMTSTRPYRPRMSVEESIEEILRCKGTQFDPEVVEAFLSALPKWQCSKLGLPCPKIPLAPISASTHIYTTHKDTGERQR